VELDVHDDKTRGHLLVITSPELAAEFSAAVLELTHGHTPDSFKVTVPDVLAKFDAMEPLYVAHYKQKRPSVSDDMLAVLEAGAKNKWCILKEVSNAISAGIHISHGRPSITVPTSMTGESTQRLRANSPISACPSTASSTSVCS
jgi:hypothetical protein